MIEDQPLPANTPQPEAVVTRHALDGVVRRAMLLIEQKLVQPDSIAAIAAALGVSPRQRFLSAASIRAPLRRIRASMCRKRAMAGGYAVLESSVQHPRQP